MRKIEKTIFPDAEVGGGAGGINAICNRPEAADDVISGDNVETFRDYYAVNLRVAVLQQFSRKSKSANCVMR